MESVIVILGCLPHRNWIIVKYVTSETYYNLTFCSILNLIPNLTYLAYSTLLCAIPHQIYSFCMV